MMDYLRSCKKNNLNPIEGFDFLFKDIEDNLGYCSFQRRRLYFEVTATKPNIFLNLEILKIYQDTIEDFKKNLEKNNF
jgi:hypothetical protein